MAADPVGEAIRNLFLLQRLGNGLSRDARNLIEALFNDIVGQLARIDPTAPQAAARQRARMQKLLGDVAGMSRERFDDLHRRIRGGLAQIGVSQGDVAISMLKATLGGVDIDLAPGRIGINLMKSIVDTNPIQGDLLKDWFRDASRRTTIMVRRQLQLGMAQNETIDEMVRRIRGRSVGGGKYSGGVMQTTTREAEAIVRTAVNDIANVAHLRTYEENDDVVSEVEFVATLDTRTTLICGSLDGTRWPVNSPDIRKPPLHINCRSSLVPIINWAGLGLEAPEDGTRASMGGQVSSAMKYDDWLRNQPAAVQNQILGPGRAELFRQGRVSLRDMVTNDNQIIRLRDLPERPTAAAPAWQRDLAQDFGHGPAAGRAARAWRDQVIATHGGDPEFTAFVGAVDDWQFHETQPAIRAKLAEVVAGTGDDPGARAMLRALQRAEPAPELYRGISSATSPQLLAGRYRRGEEFDWELSSFSTEITEGEKYAGWGEPDGRPVRVVITLLSGSKAVKIENLSYSFHEREWYTGGRYRVVDSRVVSDTELRLTIEHVGVPDVA